MTSSSVQPSPGRYLPQIAAGLAALAVSAFFSWYNNFFTWDLIPYMGVVLGYDGWQGASLHQEVYRQVQQLPADVVPALLHEVPYREQCFKDPAFFEAQLGFYRVKPLFTGIIYIFYKTGLPLWTAMRIPSVIGFTGLALVTFSWLRTILKWPWALAVVTLLLSGYAIQTARLTTPDALVAWLTVWIFYRMYFYGRDIKTIVPLLLLLALARIDLLLLGIPVMVWLLGSQITRGNIRQLIGRLLIAGALMFLLALLIPLVLGNRLQWYFDYSLTQSVKGYVVHAGRSIRQFSGTWLPLLLSLVLVAALGESEKKWKWLLFVLFFAAGIRWLLYPVFQERFFVGYEMVLACYLIGKLSRFNPANPAFNPSQAAHLQDDRS